MDIVSFLRIVKFSLWRLYSLFVAFFCYLAFPMNPFDVFNLLVCFTSVFAILIPIFVGFTNIFYFFDNFVDDYCFPILLFFIPRLSYRCLFMFRTICVALLFGTFVGWFCGQLIVFLVLCFVSFTPNAVIFWLLGVNGSTPVPPTDLVLQSGDEPDIPFTPLHTARDTLFCRSFEMDDSESRYSRGDFRDFQVSYPIVIQQLDVQRRIFREVDDAEGFGIDQLWVEDVDDDTFGIADLWEDDDDESCPPLFGDCDEYFFQRTLCRMTPYSREIFEICLLTYILEHQRQFSHSEILLLMPEIMELASHIRNNPDFNTGVKRCINGYLKAPHLHNDLIRWDVPFEVPCEEFCDCDVCRPLPDLVYLESASGFASFIDDALDFRARPRYLPNLEDLEDLHMQSRSEPAWPIDVPYLAIQVDDESDDSESTIGSTISDVVDIDECFARYELNTQDEMRGFYRRTYRKLVSLYWEAQDSYHLRALFGEPMNLCLLCYLDYHGPSLFVDSDSGLCEHRYHARNERASYHCTVEQSKEFLDSFRSALFTQLFQSADSQYALKMIEDIGILVYYLTQARGVSGYAMAISTFVKLRTTGPILVSEYTKALYDRFRFLFCDMVAQAEDEPEDKMEGIFRDIRCYLDRYSEIKNSPVFEKLHRFLMYALSLQLFEGYGITFDLFRFSQVEQEAKRKEFRLGPDFVHCMLDTITFLCERGVQCMKSGSMDPIYHSGPKVEQWYNRVVDLKRQSLLMQDPESHGLTSFKFVDDLKKVIEEGEALSKHAVRMQLPERKLIAKLLSDLRLIQSLYLTTSAALKCRKAPCAWLIYGGSSVGKTTFVKLLYYHYGKLFNLPIEDEFMFARDPMQDFWTGFRSSMWCIWCDDIACFKPDVVASDGGDPTLKDTLQVNNICPFNPPQAALEDKGRTPVRALLLLATTNTRDLNVTSYFSCPLAVARRFPYVIELTPKAEYVKDLVMLDGGAVPTIKYGEYPDYWDIKVWEVKPAGTRKQGARAVHVLHSEYSNVYEFITFFSDTCLRYDEIQKKALDCERNMAGNEPGRQVKLCPICHVPDHICHHSLVANAEEESDEETKDSEPMTTEDVAAEIGVDEQLLALDYLHYSTGSPSPPPVEEPTSWFFTKFCALLLYSCYRWWWCMALVQYTFGFGRVAVWCSWCLMQKDLYSRVFYFLGNKIQADLSPPRVAKIAAGFAGLLVAVKGVSLMYSMFGAKDDTRRVQSGYVDPPQARAPSPLEVERENVWYKNAYQLTEVEVSAHTKSWSTWEPSTVHNVLSRNCVRLFARYTNSDGERRKIPSIAFGFAHQYYLVNSHCIPENDSFTLDVFLEHEASGCSRNLSIETFKQSDVFRFPDCDLAILFIRNLPPVPNYVNLFSQASLRGSYNGMYVGRTRDGDLYKNSVKNLQLVTNYSARDLKIRTNVWFGTSEKPTEFGDCGAIMVAHSSRGPVILGIHFLGGDAINSVGVNSVTQEFLRSFLTDQTERGVYHVQSGYVRMSAPSSVRTIMALHPKSCVRFIEQGTINVFGSVSGARAKPKSAVCATAIQEQAVLRGYTVKYGPPSMHPWKPRYLAMANLVLPCTAWDVDVLRCCADSFLEEIFAMVPADAFSMVHEYDLLTVVNGAPGVAFVDAINRDTSAGFPWNRTKRKFMFPIEPYGDTLDPVMFSDEILDRVNDCSSCYDRGELYHPVYTASYKDEPRTFEKAAGHNTRLFTGAPVEHTIVGRTIFLGAIRLIQNYNEAFECAVGITAQSLQWEWLYELLTYFNKILGIAGDFKKFDQRFMGPIILYFAFYVLIALLKHAKCSPKTIQRAWCFAYDTMFWFANFQGDLVQFLTGSPSGILLTAIINSLGNSLGMRYCFSLLNPSGGCKDFKSKVKLITYGDDNASNVHSSATWFNHTAIQSVFKTLGIEYTMARKEDESTLHEPIEKITFLKRSWKWDQDVGAFLAPLDHESIEKMLTVCVRSKCVAVTLQEQTIDAVSSAVREYFFYGKSTFESRKALLQDIVTDAGLFLYVKPSTFPSWESLYNRFWLSSKHVRLRRKCEIVMVPDDAEIDSWEPLVPPENLVLQSKVEEGLLCEVLINQKTQSQFSYCLKRNFDSSKSNKSVETESDLLGRSPKSHTNWEEFSWSSNLESHHVIALVGYKRVKVTKQ